MKTCHCCGTTHTPADWDRLQYVGHQEQGSGEPALEIRLCSCGSSLAIEPGQRLMAAMVDVIGELGLEVVSRRPGGSHD